MPAEVIRITVPERRLRPGRTITVAALRIPTTAERPGRPVVFLMGGPGIPRSAMALVPSYFTLFQRLRELADVVIVDQRSLGRSEPAIDCPVDKAPPADLSCAGSESSRPSAIGWRPVRASFEAAGSIRPRITPLRVRTTSMT